MAMAAARLLRAPSSRASVLFVTVAVFASFYVASALLPLPGTEEKEFAFAALFLCFLSEGDEGMPWFFSSLIAFFVLLAFRPGGGGQGKQGRRTLRGDPKG